MTCRWTNDCLEPHLFFKLVNKHSVQPLTNKSSITFKSTWKENRPALGCWLEIRQTGWMKVTVPIHPITKSSIKALSHPWKLALNSTMDRKVNRETSITATPTIEWQNRKPEPQRNRTETALPVATTCSDCERTDDTSAVEPHPSMQVISINWNRNVVYTSQSHKSW